MLMEREIQKTEREVKKLQDKLTALMAALIASLVTAKGKILPVSENYAKVSRVDNVYREFNNDYQIAFLAGIIEMLKGRDEAIRKYFSSIGLVTGKSSQVNALTTQMQGYMKDFAKGDILIMDLKRQLTAAIATGRNPAVVIRAMNKQLKGELEKYYDRYMWTTLMEFERINNLFYADKFDLNYFIYRGGLIKTSRVFCIEKNDQLFHRDDAEKWRFDPNLPGGDEGIYEPLVMLGKYNCRHFLQWITDEMAKENK